MPKTIKERGTRLRRRTRESAPSPPATFESLVHNELTIIPEDLSRHYAGSPPPVDVELELQAAQLADEWINDANFTPDPHDALVYYTLSNALRFRSPNNATSPTIDPVLLQLNREPNPVTFDNPSPSSFVPLTPEAILHRQVITSSPLTTLPNVLSLTIPNQIPPVQTNAFAAPVTPKQNTSPTCAYPTPISPVPSLTQPPSTGIPGLSFRQPSNIPQLTSLFFEDALDPFNRITNLSSSSYIHENKSPLKTISITFTKESLRNMFNPLYPREDIPNIGIQGGRSFAGWRIKGYLECIISNENFLLHPRDDKTVYKFFEILKTVLIHGDIGFDYPLFMAQLSSRREYSVVAVSLGKPHVDGICDFNSRESVAWYISDIKVVGTFNSLILEMFEECINGLGRGVGGTASTGGKDMSDDQWREIVLWLGKRWEEMND